MVAQKSEGSSKGNRQFAGGGCLKLVGTELILRDRSTGRRWRMNATQRIVVVPSYGGNDRRCSGFSVRPRPECNGHRRGKCHSLGQEQPWQHGRTIGGRTQCDMKKENYTIVRDKMPYLRASKTRRVIRKLS